MMNKFCIDSEMQLTNKKRYTTVPQTKQLSIDDNINELVMGRLQLKMTKTQFPIGTFKQALTVAKSIKSKLKQFLQEYNKGNIPWIYQSISILHHNLVDPAIQPALRLNSMFAVRFIVETCQFSALAFIEAYIFPIIKTGAAADADLPDHSRGIKFFSYQGKPPESFCELGQNYVKLCSEILKVLELIKPYRLYYNQFTQDPSAYTLANQELRTLVRYPNETYYFFKDNPNNMKASFKTKLEEFKDQRVDDYQKFVEHQFDKQIRNGFKGQQLDIRKLLVTGDCYFIEQVAEQSHELLTSDTHCNTLRLVINFINMLVQSGHAQAMMFMLENSQPIKWLVREVINIKSNNKGLDRGFQFMPSKTGTPEQRKQLYIEFMRDLQLWANTYTKNLFKDKAMPSKLFKYYKILKENYQFEFPYNPLLNQQVKESEQRYQQNRHLNAAIKRQNEGDINQENNEDSLTLPDNSRFSRVSQVPPSQVSQSHISQSSVSQSHVPPSQVYQSHVPPSQVYQSRVPPSQVSQSHVPPSQVQQSHVPPSQVSQSQVPSWQVSQSHISNPQNSYQYSGMDLCFLKIKKAKDIIASLSHSQRNLPTTMRTLEQQMKQLQKISEETNLSDDTLEKIIDLEEEYEKIKKIYQEYKVNNIDFDKFCNQLNHQSLARPPSIPPQSKVSQDKGKSSQSLFRQQSNPSSEPMHGKQSSIKRDGRSAMQGQSLGPIKQSSRFGIPEQQEDGFSSRPQENGNLSHRKTERNKKDPKVQFSRSELNQSLFTNTEKSRLKYTNENPQFMASSQPNISSIKQQQQQHEQQQQEQQISAPFILPRQQITVPQSINIKHRKHKLAHTQQPQQKSRTQFRPITTTKNQQIQSKEQLTSPIKNKSVRIEGINDNPYQDYMANDQFIEGPSLNPLDNSYHDFNQTKENQKKRTFKQAIYNTNMLIRTNKKQNLYWFETQSLALVRPVSCNHQKRKNQVSITVPELLEERNKKHEMEIKLLQHSKEMRIRELETKVNTLQRQNVSIAEELKAKQLQIKSIKQSSEMDPNRSRVDQFSIIDDQNFLMRKLNLFNQNIQKQKKIVGTAKKTKIITTGQLINTKLYAKIFEKYTNDKQKKIHVKNKELLFKNQQLQIGYMSHLEGEQLYKITCFITPETNFKLQSINIDKDDNLRIDHNFKPGLEIKQRKQQRIYFVVDILEVPYTIPETQISYRLGNQHRTTKFVLPCAFHKFFTINPIDESILQQQFNIKNVIRGEQIPFNKKILKSIDLLQDFLPHIEKLNHGEPNQMGEICYGGQAHYKTCRFLLKVSVKPNQFLYMQSIDPKKQEDRKIIDFYIATLNHFLMKNITWN